MRSSRGSAMIAVVACGAILSIGLCPFTVTAGLLASTPHALDNDLGPGPGGVWQGSVPYTRTLGANNVTATVEFAVFGRDRFQDFLDDHWAVPPADPAPDEIVYAYQIVDVTAANPGISKMTVGLDNFDIPGTVSPPSWILNPAFANEQAPSATGYNVTSMVWDFIDNSGTVGVDERLNAGQQSPVLIFSSKYLPELDNLALASGVAGSPAAFDSVPSIGSVAVPEPSSVALIALVLGTACGGAIRRRN